MFTYVVIGCFIVADVVTGFIKAWYKKIVNSTILRQGLFHKSAECIAVGICALIQYGANYINLGVDLPCVEIVGSYICIMELISVIENLSEINPQIGRFFKPYLGKFKTESEEQKNDEAD